MKLHLDFGGFYDSIHMAQIESCIESEIDYHGKDIEDSIDWDQTKVTYSEGYVNVLNNHLDLNLKFIGIDSPRFYNYRNDYIIVEVSDSDVDFLLNDIYNSYFIEYVDERLKSRDGFHSFYDDGIISPFDNIVGKAYEGKEGAMEHLLEMHIEWMIENNDINDYIYDIEFFIEYVD